MRRLTFLGFLQSYVRSLSGEDTLALARLVELSASEPRLVAPMVLLAVLSGAGDRLERLLVGRDALRAEVQTLVALHSAGLLERALGDADARVRPEYVKAWRSYVARRDAHLRDKDVRLRARSRVLALEKQKGVTRYRMAKDLGLNPGNLHAFLAQADPTKLSLDRVAELIRYLEAA